MTFSTLPFLVYSEIPEDRTIHFMQAITGEADHTVDITEVVANANNAI